MIVATVSTDVVNRSLLFAGMVRMQNMGEGWTRWRARVGRVPATVDDEKGTLLAAPNGGTLAEERQHDAIVVFAQEMYIDGLRCAIPPNSCPLIDLVDRALTWRAFAHPCSAGTRTGRYA